MSISNSFMTFIEEAPEQQKAWSEFIVKLDNACKLDKKTEALAYLAVLASTRHESGIPFHVKQAKELGASREEIMSSILVGFPAVGNVVIQSLPIALAAFDE
ncbi:carboxymuconolactone decarboxylase family protein [Clostridium sp. WILCCON 0269]|uniref:Carboxymuconolactone decarboxylase family protein n=1 Tax=Candidatus Clostridium eludens TaxID=3381663 RepID=A0ABW8SEE3_9CLOT